MLARLLFLNYNSFIMFMSKKLNIAALFQKRPFWLLALSIVAAIILNFLFCHINALLNLPFFFDSIWTATVAALFGPIPGIIVGLFMNTFQELIYGFPLIHYPFGLCGATTGLIIGLMSLKNKFETLFHAVIASLLVTLSNSILGAIIATYMFGGITGVPIDYLVTGLLVTGQSILSATFWARIPANLIDKTIAVFIAFFIYKKVYRKKIFTN